MNPIQVYESQYKDIPSLIIENDRLIVTVIPESGSKIQSIYDKLLQKEYLIQSQAESFNRSTYDSNFGEGDVSGFDEIFPSIEACYYPAEPWEGVRIPDHGEVWCLPWRYEIEEESIHLSVHGVRFPYRLQKKIQFIRDNCIRITYRAENFSDFDFPFIWAPHILFHCSEDSEIVLPSSVKRIISTCSVENRLGKFGNIHNWPVTLINDEPYHIAKLYPKYPGKCEKYYAMDTIEEGWCALHDKLTGNVIGLSYPIEKVPYLGVWEGIMDDRYVTALEPCTGDLDDLNTAVRWNRVNEIKGKSSYEWFLNITVDTVQNLRSINENGFINEVD